jgi:phosphoribosyl-ATP pyrophosphohydrolase
MLNELYQIIKDRQKNPRHGSYTNELLEGGYQRIAQKVGEEAIEVIIAAGKQGRRRVIEESADLLYHLFVLLVNQEIDLQEVEAELERRHIGAE